MEKDIFGQETKILAAAKKTLEDGGASSEAYNDLVTQYGKLLRTTKKIIRHIRTFPCESEKIPPPPPFLLRSSSSPSCLATKTDIIVSS